MDTINAKIEELIVRAAEAKEANEAMQFTQAALNAALALHALVIIKREEKT